MAWSLGSFSRYYGATGWTDDKNASIYILSSRHDTHDQDLATGINACLTRDNQSKPTATFLPAAAASYDLGSTGATWRNIFISGTGSQFDSQNIQIARTAAELAALVTPINYYRPAGYATRLVNNTLPGTTDMTTGITSDIAQAIQTGGNLVFFPSVSGGSGTTANDWAVTSAINITGPVMFQGETDRLSFQGPRINKTNNAAGTAAQASMFTITGAQAIAVTFERLGFTYSGASAIANSALFYCNPSGAGPNSLYFRNAWFYLTPYYALNISGVDDVQVLGCTFDVTAQKWFGFGGGSAGKVTNVSLIGNTIYSGQVQSVGLADLVNVDGLIFSGNRVYADSTHVMPYGLNASFGVAISVTNLQVIGNRFNYVNLAVQVCNSVSSAIVSNNTIANTTGPAIAGGGGLAINNIEITSNTISGYAPYPFGLIDFTATPITNSILAHNTILCQGGTAVNVTATNASPCVFTGAITSMANGMPIILGGTAVPTGFVAGTTYFMVGVSGSTFNLAAAVGGSAINSTSTGTSVTATPQTAYGVVLTGSPNTNNTIGPNAISGYAISAYNITTWAGNDGSVGPLGVNLTLTGASGTPTVGARYSVKGNMVTLEIPAANAAATGVAVTLTGLPAAIQPVNTQLFSIIVFNNSANAFGTLSIGPSGTITLGVGATSAAFANAGTQGIANTSVTYQLS